MPNHYHFLLRQDGSRTVGEFLQSTLNSYTKSFNVMYNRSGTLFEGPFKAIHVDKLAYLVHLCCYIHRKPLESRLVGSLEGWKYSNYLEWVWKRNWGLVDREFIKENFSNPREYERFVLEYEASRSITAKMGRYVLD